jgi:hypothetical protein
VVVEQCVLDDPSAHLSREFRAVIGETPRGCALAAGAVAASVAGGSEPVGIAPRVKA